MIKKKRKFYAWLPGCLHAGVYLCRYRDKQFVHLSDLLFIIAVVVVMNDDDFNNNTTILKFQAIFKIIIIKKKSSLS